MLPSLRVCYIDPFVDEFIRQYGLIAVFAGTYLEGDFTVLLAGVAAHLKILSLRWVFLVGFIAGVLRDVTCYFLGRSSERARQSEVYARTAQAVERLAGRYGDLEIVFAPFVYGVRTASMIFWGVKGLSLPRFIALDVVGCFLWAVSFAAAGYFLSDRAEDLIGEVKRVEYWLLGAIVLTAAVAVARRLWLRRR